MQEMDRELPGGDFCDISSAPQSVGGLSPAAAGIPVAEPVVSCYFADVVIGFREKEGGRCVRKSGYCWQ